MSSIKHSIEWAAAEYFKPVLCLQQSAALVLLMRRRGIAAELILGVSTFPFEAHAWADFNGYVINDTLENVKRFLILDRL
jgi:hypothetical protein